MNLKINDFVISVNKEKPLDTKYPFFKIANINIFKINGNSEKRKEYIYILLNMIDFFNISSFSLLTKKINGNFSCVNNFRRNFDRYIEYSDNIELNVIVDENKEFNGLFIKDDNNFVCIIDKDYYDRYKTSIVKLLNRIKTKVRKDEPNTINNDIDNSVNIEDNSKDLEKYNKEVNKLPKSKKPNIVKDLLNKHKEISFTNETSKEIKKTPDKINLGKKSKNSNEGIKIKNHNKVDNKLEKEKVISNNAVNRKLNKRKPEKVKFKNPIKTGDKEDYTKNIEKEKKFYIQKESFMDKNGVMGLKPVVKEYVEDIYNPLDKKYIVLESELNLSNDVLREDIDIIMENINEWEINMTLSELGYTPSEDKNINIKLLQKAMQKYGKKYVNNILLKHK